jgi:hypothetical protein
VLLYEHASHEPVRLMHPSFPDFLIHEGRCTDARYFIDGAAYQSLLALRCLQIMNADLRRNICDLRNPFLPNSDVPDLDQRLVRNASAQLRYACKYWPVHVRLITEVPVALRDLPTLLSYLEVCATPPLSTSTDISLIFRAVMRCATGVYTLFLLT